MNVIIKTNFNSESDLFLSRFIPSEVQGKKLGNKNTYEQYKRGITKLIEFMLAREIRSVDDMTLPVLQMMQKDLLERYSTKTTQVYLGVVKEFFYYLQNRGVIKTNDFVSFKIVTVDKREQKTPTLSQVEAKRVITHVMSQPDTPLSIIDKLIFLIFMNTGIREEEITHIKINDIVKQGQNLVINIHGKGMRKRFVVLSPAVSIKLMTLRGKLENALMAPLNDDDYLIQSMAKNTKGKNTKAIHRTSICDRVRNISDDVKIYFTPHALRRTFATIQYVNGTPMEAIQRIMGHENVTTTQGYIDTLIDKEVGVKYATNMVG